jgi:hypothetical protein
MEAARSLSESYSPEKSRKPKPLPPVGYAARRKTIQGKDLFRELPCSS